MGKPKKWKLHEERAFLEDRQRHVRLKYETLNHHYEEQMKLYEKKLEEGDLKAAELALKGANGTLELIKAVEAEYNGNFDRIEQMSKVSKTDAEKNNSMVATGIAILTGAGSYYLGKKALDMAYDADKNGTMVNKKVYDFFNRINPIRLLKH